MTADHLGSPRIITDGGGMVVARHDYMAFGNDVIESIGAVGGRATAQGYGAPEEVRQGYTGRIDTVLPRTGASLTFFKRTPYF